MINRFRSFDYFQEKSDFGAKCPGHGDLLRQNIKGH